MPTENQQTVGGNEKGFGLTCLEKQIIALLLAGYTDKESGRKLGVTEHRVSQCVDDIIAKLRVANRFELILFALHHHMTCPIQIGSIDHQKHFLHTRPHTASGRMNRLATKAVG